MSETHEASFDSKMNTPQNSQEPQSDDDADVDDKEVPSTFQEDFRAECLARLESDRRVIGETNYNRGLERGMEDGFVAGALLATGSLLVLGLVGWLTWSCLSDSGTKRDVE
jgi:hypothetical protein